MGMIYCSKCPNGIDCWIAGGCIEFRKAAEAPVTVENEEKKPVGRPKKVLKNG